MKERHDNLKDHSVLLVESQKLLGVMFAECLMTQQMRRVDVDTRVPHNLSQLMEECGINTAIVHISSNEERVPVLNAHAQGKRVIVIRRPHAIDCQDARTYKQLEEAGIPMVDKQGDFIDKALELLSNILKEQG